MSEDTKDEAKQKEQLPPYTGKRKLMIVIEDNGQNDNRGFNLLLEGDKDRIGKVHPNELGPAEFWGSKLFSICVDAVQRAGAIQTMTNRETGAVVAPSNMPKQGEPS